MLDRTAVIQTPIGATALTFTHLTGRDEISRCFSYTVGFVSNDAKIDPLKMLGGVLSIEGEAGDPKRWFSGLISEFRLTRIEDKIAHYEAVMRPWLWFLGNSTDCRIFQKKTVVEIIEEIFGEYSIARFEKRLRGTYPVREYCVQYDESDLDFVQRLMEHEGIFYFFEHAEGEHTLVLTDAMSKLKPAPGYESVSFHDEGGRQRLDKEYITEWAPGSAVRPGAYTHTDYDFKKPNADLMAASIYPFSHKQADGELYRHPGSHLDIGRGDKIAAIRREEAQAPHQRISAAGTVRGLFSGCTFKLEDFPRDDQNQEYLVVSAEYRVFDPRYTSGVEFSGDSFTVLLGVAPTAVPYRPPRITPRPIMRGPQTATVVGPEGEEIYTDEYARVKIQFHWDRLGKKDHNSSCFVRVSQSWAGSGWGFIQIPRIGQEVIVDFIEGDPDLPIITGRVYNAAQMPPYKLPANATRSVWRSNSSKGGGGFNEISFEDKAGEENMFLHAQKDQTIKVLNNRAKRVEANQIESIGSNKSIDVGGNHQEKIGGSMNISVGGGGGGLLGALAAMIGGSGKQMEQAAKSIGDPVIAASVSGMAEAGAAVEVASLGANSAFAGAGNHFMEAGTDQMSTAASLGGLLSRIMPLSGILNTIVEKIKSDTIGLMRTEQIGLLKNTMVGHTQTTTVGKKINVQVGKLYNIVSGEKYHGEAKVWEIYADDEIRLSAPGGYITIDKEGIHLHGLKIDIEGNQINFKQGGKGEGASCLRQMAKSSTPFVRG